jgi:CRISPR-associated endonuclease/helicase Cas3
MRWQNRLFDQFIDGKIPAALDLPTGLGKTSVMAIWVLARALATEIALRTIPRRLVYVVDRRAVVDQPTVDSEELRTALEADRNSSTPMGWSCMSGREVTNMARTNASCYRC